MSPRLRNIHKYNEPAVYHSNHPVLVLHVTWSLKKDSRVPFLQNRGTETCKYAAAAAAKSLQSCPTLCDPRDSSPPGSPVLGILQARTLEWVAIFSSCNWPFLIVQNLLRLSFQKSWPGCSNSSGNNMGLVEYLLLCSLYWLAVLKFLKFGLPNPYQSDHCLPKSLA